MRVTEFGILMEVKELHSAKAFSPMLVTEFGILMEVKALQPAKALIPMLVTEFGILMEVKELQPQKALSPMLVTSHIATLLLISADVAPLSSSPFTVAVLADLSKL